MRGFITAFIINIKAKIKRNAKHALKKANQNKKVEKEAACSHIVSFLSHWGFRARNSVP